MDSVSSETPTSFDHIIPLTFQGRRLYFQIRTVRKVSFTLYHDPPGSVQVVWSGENVYSSRLIPPTHPLYTLPLQRP